MRQRNKPWADKFIAENPQYLIPEPVIHQGKWSQLFGNNQPIHIEVGTGKGQFIYGMAGRHPEINFIGIEVCKKVIVSALQKITEQPLPNLKLLMINAEKLTDYFAAGEVARIYLNFSDPWPKTRHEKRRLTYERFLAIYQTILAEQGEIHFKTDNRSLFEYSLMSFNAYGMAFQDVCLDLHQSDCLGNIMTEYEEKFSAKGHPIFRCEVRYTGGCSGIGIGI